MIITDYRTKQRNDLRDVGASQYFQDADLDDFHGRAILEYQRYKPLLKPYSLVITSGVGTIALPLDWIGVHEQSFQQALGLDGSYMPVETGYGYVFQASDNYAPAIGGLDMDFLGSSSLYSPLAVPTAAPPTYTFLNSPPQLIIAPTPDASAAGTYAMFYLAGYGLPPATPTTAPTIAGSSTGGTIPAGAYDAKFTIKNAMGETMASPASTSVTLTGATSSVTVGAGAPPLGGQINVYLGASGSEVLAGSYTTGTSMVITALPTGTPTPLPAFNTAASLVPDADSDLVLAYACYLACEAVLGDPTATQSYKIADEQIDRRAWVAAVQRKSQTKLAAFERRTRFRPLGSMG